MNKTIVKSALVMSISLLCAGVSPSAKAANSWSTNFPMNNGRYQVFCNAEIKIENIAFASYKVACNSFVDIISVGDDVYTWKWSAAGGNKKSTRYVCGGPNDALPQQFFGVGLCWQDPKIVPATIGTYNGIEVHRTYTYEPCRAGLPPLGIHYRLWSEGYITFTVKLKATGETKVVTTPVLKSDGKSHYSKDPYCGFYW